MMRYAFVLFILSTVVFQTVSQENVPAYKFRIYLNDKNGTAYHIHNPGSFLSDKAIERRKKQNITVDSTDLPLPAEYIRQIEELNCTIVAKSKWLNTITVHTEDSVLFISKIENLPFVSGTSLVWKNIANKPKKNDITQNFKTQR